MEIVGSPKFPGYPFEHMIWSQTPVVSHELTIYAHETAAFRVMKPVGFPKRTKFAHYPYCPQLYIFRGSIQTLRPRFPQLRTPVAGVAREVHYCPTGYALGRWDLHPLGNNIEFHLKELKIPTIWIYLGTIIIVLAD